MTIEEKLDFVLAKVASGKFSIVDQSEYEKELYPRNQPIDINLKLKGVTEWMQLVNKLIEDGLIDNQTADFNPYVLTLKGKMFKGYVQQKINEEQKASLEKITIDRAEKNADRLTLGTWALVGVTLLLVIVEILKNWDCLQRFFCNCKN